MISYYSDLRSKEVIDVHTGFRLGYVCDAEFCSIDISVSLRLCVHYYLMRGSRGGRRQRRRSR